MRFRWTTCAPPWPIPWPPCWPVRPCAAAGGFSANSQLRAKLLEFGENYGVDVRIPQIKLCTDNGAMVAMLGVNLVEAGVAPSAPDFPIDSAMPLTKVSM